MTKEVQNDIFKWLGKDDDSAESPKKYKNLEKYFLKNITFSEDKVKSVLIIGGGTCKSEQLILKSFNLQNLVINSYDLVKPKIYDKNLVKELNWTPGSIGKDCKIPINEKHDIVICLATSRFLHNPFKVLKNLKSLLNENGLIFFDFYDLPPLKKNSVDFMNKWFLSEWSKNKSLAKKKLLNLANISKRLGDHLSDKKINFKISAPELGIKSGKREIQTIIYESFFPFWSNPGASVEKTSHLLAWQFLSISNDYDKKKINDFCKKNKLKIRFLNKINNDTNLLICSK